jgi:predicted GH43/DUF377 family glycosyl hydrolase
MKTAMLLAASVIALCSLALVGCGAFVRMEPKSTRPPGFEISDAGPPAGNAMPGKTETLAGARGFVPYLGNPVISPGAVGEWDAGALGSMTVVRVGATFHMYYEAWGVRSAKEWSRAEYDSLQIGHATSPDGIHWVKDPANPVIRRGDAEDAWDRHGTWDPFVIHENGIFKMWYGGGNKVCDWGYAESKDGTRFTKKGRISRLGKVEDCHVIHDKERGEYHMYYWDRAREPLGLFRASSRTETDFEFTAAIPVRIESERYPAMYKFTQVFRAEGRWYMLYGDFERPHCPRSTVRLADSPDGRHWTKLHGNLVEGHDGEFITLGPKLHAIYFGRQGRFDAQGCDIRVALFRGSLESLAGADADD